MGQAGQTQTPSLKDRVAGIVDKIESGTVTVVKDVADTVTEPQSAMTGPAPVATETAPDATSTTVDESVIEQLKGFAAGDVELLRGQLEQVVTNFRSRVDSHEGLLGDLQTAVADVKTTVEALSEKVATHEGLISDIATALETLSKD